MVENNNPDIKTIIKASYKPQRDAEADLVKLGYKYDPELSTMENKVFYDPKTGKPNIAYRGSVRVKDWIGNLKLGLGFKDPDAERRIQLADQVKQKYGQAPDTFSHSRGGYIGEQAGERYGGKTYTYNKATLPQDIFKTIRPEQTDIRTEKDIVSLPSYFQTGGNKQTISSPFYQDYLSAHSTSNLL
jgi:hypothetical protein